MNINDIRITGEIEDLDRWDNLLLNLEAEGKIEILESSNPYKNRNSKLYRKYIKVRMK